MITWCCSQHKVFSKCDFCPMFLQRYVTFVTRHCTGPSRCRSAAIKPEDLINTH